MNEYICTLCPRECAALRSEQSGSGFCGMGTLPKVARIAPHFWEEPCISGTKGSGTVFFSGCVLGCVFCQNDQISRKKQGRVMTVSELTEEMRKLTAQGVHNINLVSPTPYIETIITLFSAYRPNVPVVYNTGGYEKAESLRRLEGIVDIYLPDLKYIDSEKSSRYSCAGNYAEYALPAIREMLRQTGKPQFDENGILQKGTVVRHLILPQNTQYIPMGRSSDFPEIDRRITKREYEKVLDEYDRLGLNGFVQERSSATKDFVPDWNLL